MQRALPALALVSLAVIAGGCAGGSPQATSLPGLTAAKTAKLKTLARTAARANGDAHPSSVTVYASRRHEANIAAGAGTGVQGSEPVYLVVIRGNFGCSSCSGPGPGAKEPKGDVITMVLGRSTLQSLDFGIGGRVDTSTVGPGMPLRLSSGA